MKTKLLTILVCLGVLTSCCERCPQGCYPNPGDCCPGCGLGYCNTPCDPIVVHKYFLDVEARCAEYHCNTIYSNKGEASFDSYRTYDCRRCLHRFY